MISNFIHNSLLLKVYYQTLVLITSRYIKYGLSTFLFLSKHYLFFFPLLAAGLQSFADLTQKLLLTKEGLNLMTRFIVRLFFDYDTNTFTVLMALDNGRSTVRESNNN